jgi:hypothetical protein
VCMRTFLLRKPMRGKDDRSEILFSYIRLDERIPADHPLRVIRQLVDAALAELSRAFAKLYARDGRPSIPPERLLSHGLTMGMVLSAPMLAIGIALLDPQRVDAAAAQAGVSTSRCGRCSIVAVKTFPIPRE